MNAFFLFYLALLKTLPSLAFMAKKRSVIKLSQNSFLRKGLCFFSLVADDLTEFISVYLIHRGILVCTDVMGRGMDFADIEWVIQYDPPSSAR